MQPLTLHFEATPGTDLEAVASEIKASISGQETAQVVEATPQRFQAIGAGEIIALIALVPSIPQGIAALPKAIEEVKGAWKKLQEKFPGLRPPTVEVGLRNVPIDQLQGEDFEELVSED
jgi:hypothetical protein